jgi:hypothetical protein
MENRPPLETLAGGDVSDELAAILRSIADITANDTAKYSAAVCRRLTRWIVCRSYGGPLRELCHLIVASDRAIGATARVQGYETLFWGSGVARPRTFRRIFHDCTQNAGVTPLGGGLQVTYADGQFGIAYTRMPFLSALMEFLVSVFGYADLDAKFRAIPAGQVTKGAVDALANDLSRQVYHFLSEHLPSVQSHRKFRAVMSFLRQTNDDVGNSAIGPHSIDDDTVLAFWIFASNEALAPGGSVGDFRSFKSVFRLMAAAREALTAASQALAIDRALPIGSDRAAREVDPGEITPEAVDAALAPHHERQAPLDVLRGDPANQIKFLKQTELDAIAPVIDFGETALALPLSVLRLQVMGALQARMTEAMRRGEAPLSLPHLDRLNSVSCAYGDYAGYIDRVEDNLQSALLASFHHLTAARREEAITVLLYLRPDMDLSPLASLFADGEEELAEAGAGQIVHLKAPETPDRFLRTLTAGLDQCPEFVALIGEAGAAAKRITRQGFKDADWAGERGDLSAQASCDRADAFAAASDALIMIRDSLLKFTAHLQRLGRRHGGWNAQYLSDHKIFCAQFRTLYGDL